MFKDHITDLEGKNKLNDSTSGVGIGLKNSLVLAESLGGTVDVKSQQKVGTEVVFTVETGVE